MNIKTQISKNDYESEILKKRKEAIKEAYEIKNIDKNIDLEDLPKDTQGFILCYSEIVAKGYEKKLRENYNVE